MAKIAVIGGGAAGIYAAIWAARAGEQVHLFEKNEKLGKKLYITGKGRCNVTNADEMDKVLRSVVTNPKFLYSAFSMYDNQQFMEDLEQLGVDLKTERGGRVFPKSDHASTIISALERELKRLDVKIHLRSEVKKVLSSEGKVTGILLENKSTIQADAVIVATGGFSYQTTGSTGDGYRFAESLGITVTPRIPSLVPMETREEYIVSLQGLSLRNVTLTIFNGKKKVFEEFGEMLFTHFGVTGPLVLSASAYVGKLLSKQELTAYIDLKPALSEEMLDQRVLREFDAGIKKQFKNVIGSLFPSKLEPVMIELSGISPEKKVTEITREERKHFVELIKHFPFTITGLRDFNEAIITKGGISVKEINPKTMESKKVKNLYFVGEVLDVDALTGGYNLQIAWSTAFLAGNSVQQISE